jgi:MoaA/NifB/PqqE/SkfB family radical SAM enzyme
MTYESVRADLVPKIEAGKRGDLRLTPTQLWIKVSGRCNLHCVGCGIDRTSYQRNPTLDEVRQMLVSDSPVGEIMLTALGEALLNPQFGDIVDLCHEVYPEAGVWVCTNGTLPMTDRLRDAISKLDMIGLSIDGATKETYEAIRVGADFDVFLDHAREIAALRTSTSRLKAIMFYFTATATNIGELPAVVRLAKEIGAGVYVQPMVWVEGANDQVVDILFDRLPLPERAAALNEAQAEAHRLGVFFSLTGNLYAEQRPEPDIRLCPFPWSFPAQLQIVRDGYVVLPCCWITPDKLELLAERYDLKYQTVPVIGDVYNSPGFWRFREDILEGRMQDICGNCHAL